MVINFIPEIKFYKNFARIYNLIQYTKLWTEHTVLNDEKHNLLYCVGSKIELFLSRINHWIFLRSQVKWKRKLFLERKKYLNKIEMSKNSLSQTVTKNNLFDEINLIFVIFLIFIYLLIFSAVLFVSTFQWKFDARQISWRVWVFSIWSNIFPPRPWSQHVDLILSSDLAILQNKWRSAIRACQLIWPFIQEMVKNT